MQVGDKVGYIPHECHALQRHHETGERPWVIGRRRHRPSEDGGAKMVEHIEESKGKQLDAFLMAVKRHPDRTAMSKQVVLIRPAETWPAVVTEVHEDGTVSIDVRSNQGGCTLHYRAPVAQRNEPYTPHTCCELTR